MECHFWNVTWNVHMQCGYHNPDLSLWWCSTGYTMQDLKRHTDDLSMYECVGNPKVFVLCFPLSSADCIERDI